MIANVSETHDASQDDVSLKLSLSNKYDRLDKTPVKKKRIKLHIHKSSKPSNEILPEVGKK